MDPEQIPLRDLHLPEAIGWWPLAPGWWVLIALALAALGTLCYLLLQHRRRNAYRRRGAQQLEQLYQCYAQQGDAQALVSGVNALLKSVALVAYPREVVAPQHSGDWVRFLNAHARENPFAAGFGETPYRPGCEVDVDALKASARSWIKHHQVRR